MSELAQKCVASKPGEGWLLYVLGVAHYRAGQHEQAIRRLRKSVANDPPWGARAMSYPVLAMAHHRLGQAAEARKALDEAARALDQWTRQRYEAQGANWVHQGVAAFWPILWWDWLECQLYYREAKVLIDGSPPPDDPRLHVLRARAFAGLGWPKRAVPEYDAALRLSRQDPQVRLEAHRIRGYRYADLRQWSEAAAEFDRVSELRPEDSYFWRFRAVAHFVAREAPAYRLACADMVARFERTEDPLTAGNVLLACVLRDDALPDLARLLPLARVAAPGWRVRGAALYRAGRYDEAVGCFETDAKTYRPRAWDWCFVAMAHHRLGHAEEARRCLAEAARWIDEADRREEDDLTGTRPAWGDWHERVVYPLLLREVQELVKRQPD